MRKLSLTILLLLLVGVAVPVTALDKVKVAVAGGFNDIEAYSEYDLVHISLSELAQILGGRVTWDIVGQTVLYTDTDFKFEFLLGSAFTNLNDTTYNLTYPATLKEGQLFVPVATFVPLLDRVTPQNIVWSQQEKSIRVESEYFNVTDMAVEAKANGLLIDIYLTSPVSYEIFITEGNWLNISIRDARINRNRVLARRDSRYMYRLKVHQVENNTGQISMRLKRNITEWSHKIEYNPTRIQISIKDVNFEMDTAPAKPVLGPDNKIDVIVIDPGHGGEDNGAVGRGGTREKDVVLSIAKRLAKMIRNDKKFKVVMTRDRDKTLTLAQRAKIANDAGADLFVSIHANASPKRRVRGWNVFFLAPALNDSARAAAQLENGFFLQQEYEETVEDVGIGYDPVKSIISEMLMTEFQAESLEFAQMVDREFRRRLDTPARGIDQAGFFVLNKVFTPSVLIESAFISNESEEKKLKDKKYQESLAKGLYEAIKRFKSKYESH